MVDKNPLTEAELEFLEFFYDPTAMTECLIPKTFNAPQAWNSDCDCIIVRDYQFSMQNYSNMLAPDPILSDEENFRLRKGAGTCYMIGARDLGKSWWLIIDCVLSIIYGIVEIGVASFTADKLKKVCNSIAAFVESHKFLKMFHLKQENTKRKSVNRDPLTVNTEHGSITYAMNEHINDESKIGVQFHSKHYEVRYYEEYSYATNKGQQKGVDSGTTYGYIDRPSGIPDLCVGSPLGDILQNKKLKNWIWRLPQYVNSAWSNKIEEDKATFYKGKQTPMYKLNVEAEVLEGAFGFFDMPRLKSASFKSGGRVKFLEVHKDTFSKYEDILIVERLPGAKQCFICGDLGFGAAPTELIIVFWDGTKYKFIYNISLLRLTPEEQPEIIKYLYDKLGGAFVALDSSVHPDEFILLRVDGKIKYIRFKDLDGFKDNLLEVPTFNNDKLEWKKAKLIKHYYKGKIGNIIVSPGNSSVRVTDNHSVMVYEKDGLKTKFLKDCKVGNWMLVPKNYKIENNEYLILKYKDKLVNRHSKQTYSTIKLNEELGYFLGWCCAEGSSKTYSYQLSLGDEEKEANMLLELHRKLFKTDKGHIRILTPEYHNSKSYANLIATKNRYTVVLSGGRGSVDFFESLLGKGSHNKRVPEEIFNSPKSVQEAFIKGFFEGDGHIRNRLLGKCESINTGVASEELCSGLYCLLNILGYRGTYTIYKDKKNGWVSYKLDWAKNLQNNQWSGIPHDIINIPNKYGRKNSKLNNKKTLLKRWPARKDSHQLFDKLIKSDWEFRKIKEIKYEDYEGYVYDLEVDDNHTFVAGTGNILIHNTSDSGAMIDRLFKMGIPEDHLLKVRFNENIEIGYEIIVDSNGNEIVQKDNFGNPIMKEHNCEDWSFKELERVMYDGVMEIPPDPKFETQFTNVIATSNKGKIQYGSKGENHEVQAWQVWAICRFFNEFKSMKDQRKKRRCFGVVNIRRDE